MQIIQNDKLSLFFGAKQHAFDPIVVRESGRATEFFAQEPFLALKQQLQADALFVDYQVHGVDGVLLKKEASALIPSPLTPMADFIVTDIPRLAVAVTTADCVPVIIYHELMGVVAAVHAGWRGSVNGIVRHAVEAMKTHFAVDSAGLRAFIGPCARACCYAVGAEVIEALATRPAFLSERSTGVYCDLVALNTTQLIEIGVPANAIDVRYATCTICSTDWYSYRRDRTPLRQLSGIVIHER
ncbi:MAG: polyphenol oxidase family protein [Candidatus Babeliales bacterium]